MKRISGARASFRMSLVLGGAGLAMASAGCQEDPIVLEGIWNADMHYTLRNGEAYDYNSAQNLRFTRSGEAWSCLVNGVEAEICTFSDEHDATTLSVTATSTYQGSTYTRVRTIQLTGVEDKDDKSLAATFAIHTVYNFLSGTTSVDDFSGTANMVRLEPYGTASSGLTLLGEFGTFEGALSRVSPAHEEEPGAESGKGAAGFIATANVRVRGDYAYLARFSDGLRILNVADPANIFEVGHAAVEPLGATYYNDVKLLSVNNRDYAVMSDATIGMVVYDVTDPSQPTFVSSFFPDLASSGDHLNNHTSFIDGTVAYLGNYGGSYALDPEGGGKSGGLLMVDLADPAHPKELGRWLASSIGGTFVHDLYVADGVAYLCGWELGLVLLDVHDPANPQVMGRFTYDRMTSHSVWVTHVNGRTLAINGDEDFGGHMRVVDVDPKSSSFLKLVGEYQQRPEVSIHNIMAVGSEVVAAHYQDGVRVLDLSEPASPVEVAWFNTWDGYSGAEEYGRSFYEGGIGVDIKGDLIYLADIERGLLILQRD